MHGAPQVVGASLLVTILLATGAALANPTKDECMNANESAQGHRASGKLRQAEDELTLCVAPSCPGPVRNDCSERLNEVQRAMPTVVLAVRNGRGDDLTAVRVLLDGSPLTTELGGNAIAVDPGPHTFTFVAEHYASLNEDILVREGEKERSVSVVLQGPAEARPEVPRPPPAPTQVSQVSPRGLSTRQWIALTTTGVGVLGMGVGGILGLAALSQFETAERETGTQRHDDSVSAVNTGNVATVVMGAGGLLAVGGVVLWLTSPGHSTQVSTTGSGLLVSGSFW